MYIEYAAIDTNDSPGVQTPKYCVGLPNYTARQSVGLLNF